MLLEPIPPLLLLHNPIQSLLLNLIQCLLLKQIPFMGFFPLYCVSKLAIEAITFAIVAKTKLIPFRDNDILIGNDEAAHTLDGNDRVPCFFNVDSITLLGRVAVEFQPT